MSLALHAFLIELATIKLTWYKTKRAPRPSRGSLVGGRENYIRNPFLSIVYVMILMKFESFGLIFKTALIFPWKPGANLKIDS